jgi:hypothetical protein
VGGQEEGGGAGCVAEGRAAGEEDYVRLGEGRRGGVAAAMQDVCSSIKHRVMSE